MLKVQNMNVFTWYLFHLHGGLIFITFALTRSSVSTASLVLKYFTRPASLLRLPVIQFHTLSMYSGYSCHNATISKTESLRAIRKCTFVVKQTAMTS